MRHAARPRDASADTEVHPGCGAGLRDQCSRREPAEVTVGPGLPGARRGEIAERSRPGARRPDARDARSSPRKPRFLRRFPVRPPDGAAGRSVPAAAAAVGDERAQSVPCRESEAEHGQEGELVDGQGQQGTALWQTVEVGQYSPKG